PRCVSSFGDLPLFPPPQIRSIYSQYFHHPHELRKIPLAPKHRSPDRHHKHRRPRLDSGRLQPLRPRRLRSRATSRWLDQRCRRTITSLLPHPPPPPPPRHERPPYFARRRTTL